MTTMGVLYTSGKKLFDVLGSLMESVLSVFDMLYV